MRDILFNDDIELRYFEAKRGKALKLTNYIGIYILHVNEFFFFCSQIRNVNFLLLSTCNIQMGVSFCFDKMMTVQITRMTHVGLWSKSCYL